jgi:5-formaminoimidazole-4-carboxamide-1-(beta)-D-ribofuranosyl 5'-monophosphate synthetase
LSISKKIDEIVKEYKEKVTIGIFGSHTGRQIGMSAKTWGFKTIIICEKGREKLYTHYNHWLYDRVIILDHFREMLNKEVQEKLREMNTIFIPNRSFAAYVGYDGIENNFEVPIYGNRFLLRAEERTYEKGQYYLLQKARIPTPKHFPSPEEIDRLVIVKIQSARNPLGREDFYADSPENFYEEAEKKLRSGTITEEGLKKARIEEYVLGPKFNANFHCFGLKDVFGDFAFVGFSDRIQVNLQGFLDLPAREQLKIKNVLVKNVEIGHKGGITIRESREPMVYENAERLVRVCEREFPPGIRGSFSLQGAVGFSPENKEEFIVFDTSFRVPGDPGIGPTSPEMRNLSLRYGIKIEDPLDLAMMEIKKALAEHRLSEIVT